MGNCKYCGRETTREFCKHCVEEGFRDLYRVTKKSNGWDAPPKKDRVLVKGGWRGQKVIGGGRCATSTLAAALVPAAEGGIIVPTSQKTVTRVNKWRESVKAKKQAKKQNEK